VVYNPYIVVPAATWAVAQVSKFAIAAIKGRIDFRYLYASGGMPSVHSAVVTSLAVTSFLVDGAGSHLFGFILIFAMIVMYDSFGVRRSTGEQAVVLNLLLNNLDRNRFKLDTPHPVLREILGHQPREVSVGAVFGIVLAGLFNYDRLGGLSDFFTGVPSNPEFWSYIGVFGLLVIGGAAARWILAAQYPKSKVMKKFRGHVFQATQTIGWVGLLAGVFIFERASYLAWRVWPVLLLAAGVAWAAWIVTGSAKEVPAGLAAEENQMRKRKWLNFGRKKRK
jgi:acid phosphatase family membrane protein YuiD